MSPYSYQQALDYLDEIIRAGIKYDLNNVRRLLQLLGNPQQSYPVISVAGTNGKGSTAAFLESILTEAGYRAGLNTSPHLVSPRERLRINRQIADPEEFARAVGQVAEATLANWNQDDPHRPTFFETMTTAALVHFRDQKVDVALMEAGLGGRLDATNSLQAVLTIITRIGLDHPKTLGNTLKKIAFEKFGLARSGRPLLVAKQRNHVMGHLRQLASFRGAMLRQPSRQWRKQQSHEILLTESAEYRFRKFGIPGSYQRENAATAVAAAEILGRRGFNIPKEAVEKGIETAYWPGRMELKESEPRILMDGSHNTDGISNLVRSIKRIPAKRRFLIYGKVGERSPRSTARKLLPLADSVYLPPLHVTRANAPEELMPVVSQYNRDIHLCDSMDDAWQRVNEEYQPGDLIIVAGSLYLVGEFKKTIGDTLE